MRFVNRLSSQKPLLLSVMFIAVISLMLLSQKHVFAARGNTGYVCKTEVTQVAQRVVAGNRMYVTYEFRLEGNDYARRFQDSNGNIQTENGSVIGSTGTCNHDSAWDGAGFDYNSALWQSYFNANTNMFLHANFQSVANVYAGMGPNTNTPAVSNNYCGNVGVGINDPATFFGSWRSLLGIDTNPFIGGSCADNSVYGSINDAAIVTLNNRTLWCLGMGYNMWLGWPANQWECQVPQQGAPVDAATVYTGGGDFAGFLNASNGNNTGRLSTLYAPRVLNRQPINDLLPAGSTYVPLNIFAQNTRDPIDPSWDAACANTSVGYPNCYPPGLNWDPSLDPNSSAINNKASTFMTFEIVGGPVVRGRIFNDLNGDGKPDAGEPFIQNGVDCKNAPSPRQTLAGVYVTVSGIPGTFPPNQCNQDPYYEAYVQIGNRTVGVTVPVGWEVTTPNNVSINFGLGTVKDQWFGIHQIPTVCSNLFSVVTTPTNPEAGDAFTAKINTSGVATAAGAGIYAVRTGDSDAAALAAGSSLSGPVNYSSTSPTGATLSGLSVTTPGIYYLRWTYNGGNIAVNCSQQVPVANKPYLQVFSGDVSSGGYIKAFNKGVAPDYIGSGGQLGVFSNTSVTEFASAMLRGSWPLTPKGLTFANVAGTANSDVTYGGGFAATGAKTFDTDYWPLRLISGFTTQSANYHVAGATLNNKGAIFVDGDAYVDGNILYANTGSWNLNTIPSFYLIANGNIYINHTVTQLSGVYVAKGTIYTCTPNGDKTKLNASDIASKCNNNALTVNGAFLANKVKFLRLANTLSQGTSKENPITGTTKAAETFISGPETWLVSPFSTANNYNAITALPPVL